MPFDRPALSDLVTRIRADFRARLEIEGSLVRRAMADVLASVWSGAVHMLHGHLEWASRQLFATTADDEFLVSKASMYGISKTPATFAAGDMTATGTDTTVIPAGTVWVRDDGATYTQDADATITGGTATVSVTADTAGVAGNTDAGDTLALESPITGVDSDATIGAGGIDGGNDEETTEELRARLLLRLREPPQGGNAQDYEAWALAVAGVTRVWVYELEDGPGTVTVRFVRDNDPSIIPDASEVAEVQTAIDAQRPITADATVEAPTESATAFTIELTPDTTATRAAVTAALSDLFDRDSEPGDGAGRGTIFLSRIQGAISAAEGVSDFDVTVPAADVVPAIGVLPTLGTITWV